MLFRSAVPDRIDLTDVGRNLAALPGVVSVHDLHIWTPAAGNTALSAHVVVDDLGSWMNTLAAMRALLSSRYRIEHVTLQPETRAGITPVAPLERRPWRGA